MKKLLLMIVGTFMLSTSLLAKELVPLSANDNNIQVCISAHNKIPYIKEAGCRYIQDKTISSTEIYHADEIKVGSNVTSLMPTGPVIFMSGKTTLIGDSVELHGETTVNLGASLEINGQ